ncbi:MAG TPA: sugar kinase [Phototrophicaceae bacterium]|nr:sugar kinase [Phototrophicaceae bacterium]
MTVYDVVTLGETMLRLTPPNFRRLQQTQSLDIEVGGSESNAAVGLAKLGLRVGWLSRLTNNPLGHYITGTLAAQGVDVSQVMWTDEDRIGLYFLEEGQPPRDSRVFYDRARSAMSAIQPEDLPADLFRPGNARLLHLTGITPALSDCAAQTATAALRQALDAGWLVSFDVNYRAKLWSPAAAAAGCEPFLQAAHIILTPITDVYRLFGFAENTPIETIFEQLHQRYPQAVIVITLGSRGAATSGTDSQIYTQGVFPAEPIGRVGGGDAFDAGFLYGYLQFGDLPTALRWGAATAAIKYTIPGDMPLIEYHEVKKLVENTSAQTRLER